ncbi:kinase-like domain-containing protein [Tricladium varicosporioides]|nr:kinase-like domain-containing protein [Hymenoscyphus varicosporioides]
MFQRHIKFNVNELARVAAEAVGAKICVGIEKYPDGMYNKAMLLTMDNGTQVVAKVPNPNAGKPHFTTASEVATMDFVRNVLQTPVPEVFAWSSRAQENPVGAEYIIMEKIPGIELERLWPTMKTEDRLAIVQEIANYQKKWTSVSFKKYGGLYYSKDLVSSLDNETLYTDADGVDVKDPSFSIGPSTGRELIDNGRAGVEFNRGSWQTIEEYHKAIGHREIAAVKQLPQLPKSSISLFGPGTYIPTREKKLKALQCYLQLIKFLIPSDSSITSSHLWHGDLHVANIFVNPSKPTEITGIIDWQSTELAPLYFHARQPQIIDLNGQQYVGRERPKLPENFETLDAEGKKRARSFFLRQSLCALYNTIVYRNNPRLYAALEFQQTLSYTLLLLPRNMVIDGEASYISQVAALKEEWDTIPGARGSPYPCSFTPGEIQEMEAHTEGALLGMQALEGIRESLEELFPGQGCVRSELYEDAIDALGQMKEQVIDEFAKNDEERQVWEKWWPFGT